MNTAWAKVVKEYHALSAGPFDKAPLAEALKDLADGIRETDPWAASAAEEAIITLRIISGPDELPIIQEDLAAIEGRLRE